MANKWPLPLLGNGKEGGQNNYLILSAVDPEGLVVAFARLRSGEADYIDLQLREALTDRRLSARLRFPDGLPQKNAKFEETWHFLSGVFAELDADSSDEGPAFSCNGHFTLTDVALRGEIRVSTDIIKENA